MTALSPTDDPILKVLMDARAVVLDAFAAGIAARQAELFGGRPIATAPTDGTVVRVFVDAYQGLLPFECDRSYHPDAGWCADELRQVILWKPKDGPPCA